MRIVNVLLALFMSLALGVLALEGGLRAIGKGPPEPLLEHDEFTGWRKRTKVSVERSGPEFDVRITTNEQGLVDDPMPDPRKPAGAFRVLVLGDSFTQGFTVGRDDLYVDLLERRWVAQGRAADIVNAGTEGWSTDQEVAWFLRHGAKFEPDVVLIAAYENDLYWNGQSRSSVRTGHWRSSAVRTSVRSRGRSASRSHARRARCGTPPSSPRNSSSSRAARSARSRASLRRF
jgi:hypothetical protein